MTLGPGVARAFANWSLNSSAVRRGGVEAHTRGQLGEVDVGSTEVEHVLARGPEASGPNPVQLHVQDRVGVVVEEYGGHVEALAGHRPPRLQGVHGAAVGLQGHHPPSR